MNAIAFLIFVVAVFATTNAAPTGQNDTDWATAAAIIEIIRNDARILSYNIQFVSNEVEEPLKERIWSKADVSTNLTSAVTEVTLNSITAQTLTRGQVIQLESQLGHVLDILLENLQAELNEINIVTAQWIKNLISSSKEHNSGSCQDLLLLLPTEGKSVQNWT